MSDSRVRDALNLIDDLMDRQAGSIPDTGWTSGVQWRADRWIELVERRNTIAMSQGPQLDPRDMHGLAIGEGVDVGNWYTYCPACSWDAGEQVSKCLDPVVAATWPDASVFVPKPSDGAS